MTSLSLLIAWPYCQPPPLPTKSGSATSPTSTPKKVGLYLAGIMDFYSRRIVGWAMDEHIDTQLILAAWNMAQTHRQPPPKLVFHSDRGCQYASADFRQALA